MQTTKRLFKALFWQIVTPKGPGALMWWTCYALSFILYGDTFFLFFTLLWGYSWAKGVRE